MLDPALISLAHEISEDFHNRVKLDWKSIMHYQTLGHDWVNSVRIRYSNDSLSMYAYDLLMTETKHFANNIGITIAGINYTALIMKGGGIKGLSYVGALEVLSEFYEFNWFAGTSAGAISAALLSCGYTSEELKDILSSKNFNDFKDSSYLKAIFNYIAKNGFYEAINFTEWIEYLLAHKLGRATQIRFTDLPNRTSIFASTANKRVLMFDSTSSKTKEVSVAFATRCSMSIPFVFTPQKNEGKNVFDGGLQNNFPVDLILKDSPNTDFVGLYLGDEIYTHKNKSLFTELLDVFMESSDPEILREHKDSIVVIDPSPISTLKFKLNESERKFLLEAGSLAALKFLHNKRLINLESEKFNYTARKGIHENNRKELKKKYRNKNMITYFLWAVIFFELMYFTNIYSISRNCYFFIHNLFK
ncbi:hypothetical protein FMM05_17475 [Flavobacterium zepuense]|uniref:PNPLA domain-containing protein n=1 Tax=Flavobacterium zepuense TaxID=2593302 RepID=A0A552UVQ4_9FLAO|nr:patatin-like phospholipase family protein [Flavobacterium zepuense]TRW22296.1 hypothetical protein FMM05_17475 [Flavobacterium zepuense]